MLTVHSRLLEFTKKKRTPGAQELYASHGIPYAHSLRDKLEPFLESLKSGAGPYIARLHEAGLNQENFEAVVVPQIARLVEAGMPYVEMFKSACLQAGMSTAAAEALAAAILGSHTQSALATVTTVSHIVHAAPLAQCLPILGIFPIVDAALGWLLWRRCLRPVDVRRMPGPPPAYVPA